MSARSTQAAKLGYEIAREQGLRRVDVRWSGTKRRGSFGGWRIEWTDGPTVPSMRTIVRRYAERYQAVPVAELGYDRCRTLLAEAVALLLFVDRDHSWADCIGTGLVTSAYEATDWPERAGRMWQDRGRALLRHTPDGECSLVTAYATRALADQARVGWDNALRWLDRLAVEHGAQMDSSNVVDLASRRAAFLATRRRRQG